MVLTRLSHLHRMFRFGAAGLGLAIVSSGLWSAPASFGPQLATTDLFSGRVQAQTAGAVSPEEVQRYASSVLGIERLRTEALVQIQQFTEGDALQGLACHQSNTVRRLSRQAKDVFVQYCSQAATTVEDNGLSITRFNEITVAQQGDAELTNQVQETLQQLQLGATSSPPQSPRPLSPQ